MIKIRAVAYGRVRYDQEVTVPDSDPIYERLLSALGKPDENEDDLTNIALQLIDTSNVDEIDDFEDVEVTLLEKTND